MPPTPKKMKKKMIDIGEVPLVRTSDGLMVRFDKGTDTTTEFAFADINEGQRYYEYPDPINEKRVVISVYKKLLLT